MVGRGNTAEVYEYGEGKVCKLFLEGYPQEYTALEYKNAVEAFRLKLPVPKPFGQIVCQKRNGILYERIIGEPLSGFTDKNGDAKALDLFVRLHKSWLSRRSEGVLPYKKYLSLMVQSRDTENIDLLQRILALPDDTCFLHGDFHPNNVLIKADTGEPVVIDFMNVCCGPALYDAARTFFLLKQHGGSLANRYLEGMGVSQKEISEFLKVIQLCRRYEG